MIAAPYTVWVAPVGTAFPLPSEAPGVSWTKVGTIWAAVDAQRQQTRPRVRAFRVR